MGYFEGLTETVLAAQSEFGSSGTYTIKGAASGTTITLELHPISKDPFADTTDRDIKSNPIYHRVKVKKDDSRVTVNDGETSDLRIAKFLVSDIPVVKEGDTITEGSNTWIII